MRNDVREAVHMAKRNGEKINFAAYARQYNCDYRTVKKYYHERDDTLVTSRKPRKVVKKIEGFEEIIKEKHLKYNAPAIAIYNLLKDDYGFTGSYSTIKAYVHTLKEEKQNEVTVRFETIPGLQCQIDWKEKMILVSRTGEVFEINVFLSILGYSRFKYVELTLDRSQVILFRCLTNSFRYYGGVPKQLLFDNMRTVVDKSRTQYDKVIYNQKFYQFSKDAGFEPQSCMAYRPETKGKVEVLAKIMNRLKAYNNEFETLEDLKKILAKLNEEINNEISQTTLEKPIDRFQKEKEYLQPEPRYDILEAYYCKSEITRKVPKDCLITYQNRKYSVNPAYAGKIVTLQIEDDILHIYYNQALVATHEINEKVINYTPEDYKLLLKKSLIKEENIERIAEENLKIFDKL